MNSQTLLLMERGWKPNVELSLTCPRCGSANTKFCYYNNYSLTQPRYFCKGCRRYWTKGGSLRNIPVGGGCRKNRRGKSLRLSTDFMSSRTTGFRTVLPDHPLGLSHGSSSSANPPDIDLALVYANFLNPQPPSSNTGNRSEPREASSSNNGPSLQNLCISSGMTDGTDSSVGLLVEAGNGLFEWESLSYLFPDAHLIKDSNQNSSTPIFDPLQALHHSMPTQPCCNEDANSYVLPPLPNDDVVVSQEVTASWSMLNDYSLRAPEQPALGPDHHQVQAEDPNLPTIITYREFDFPGEHTLPRK